MNTLAGDKSRQEFNQELVFECSLICHLVLFDLEIHLSLALINVHYSQPLFVQYLSW